MSHSRDNWAPRGIKELELEAQNAVRSTRNGLVVAGPGAGKTELLSQRACFLLETGTCPQPQKILALSFKRDAAHNLRERVKLRCGPVLAQRFESNTYASWAKGLLDRFRATLPKNFRPTSDYTLDKSIGKPEHYRAQLLAVDQDTYKGLSHYEIKHLSHASLLAKYQRDVLNAPIQLLQSGEVANLTYAWWQTVLHHPDGSVLNFPMIEALVELLIRTNPSIRAMLRATYHYVFLDEFQDTTSTQYRILKAAFHDSAAVFTAVGDNKQSIMRWAGADIDVFDTFAREFDVTWHRLTMNYRSAPWLVEIQGHLAKAIDPTSTTPKAADTGEDGRGECCILTFDHHVAEAAHVAQLIDGWVKTENISPTEVCIIVRAKAADYTTALRSELFRLGLRSRVQDEIQDLLIEPVVVAVLDTFRLCAQRWNPQSWQRLIGLVLRLRGLCDVEENGHKARKVASEVNDFIIGLRPSLKIARSTEEIKELIYTIVDFFDAVIFCQGYEQYLQVDYFYDIIDQCAAILSEVRSQTSTWVQALDELTGVDIVPVMTIHKSKGLEYHSVVFIGLEDSYFLGYKKGKTSSKEEDSNFFVAFSRAKKRVVFTFSSLRPSENGFTQTQSRVLVSSLYSLLQEAGVTISKPTTNLHSVVVN